MLLKPKNQANHLCSAFFFFISSLFLQYVNYYCKGYLLGRRMTYALYPYAAAVIIIAYFVLLYRLDFLYIIGTILVWCIVLLFTIELRSTESLWVLYYSTVRNCGLFSLSPPCNANVGISNHLRYTFFIYCNSYIIL